MLKGIFGKVNGFAAKLSVLFAVALVSVQSAFAQSTGLTLPSDTESKLVGYITDSFPVVIGIVIAVVGATLIVRMIKRAG